MKISKSIWGNDKFKELFVYRKLGDNILRLFYVSLIFLFVPACTSWPDSSERVLSISERRQEIPEEITREYLSYLLGVSQKRYVELGAVGGLICLPGQMRKVIRTQKLLSHEIDGHLFLDAEKHLIDVFQILDSIRRQIENNSPSDKCYQYYSSEYKGEVSELSDWNGVVEVEALMRGQP